MDAPVAVIVLGRGRSRSDDGFAGVDEGEALSGRYFIVSLLIAEERKVCIDIVSRGHKGW